MTPDSDTTGGRGRDTSGLDAVSREQLADDYERLPMTDIAWMYGSTVNRVNTRLRAEGIPIRRSGARPPAAAPRPSDPPPVDRTRLVKLWREGATQRQLENALGAGWPRIKEALAEAEAAGVLYTGTP